MTLGKHATFATTSHNVSRSRHAHTGDKHFCVPTGDKPDCEHASDNAMYIFVMNLTILMTNHIVFMLGTNLTVNKLVINLIAYILVINLTVFILVINLTVFILVTGLTVNRPDYVHTCAELYICW